MRSACSLFLLHVFIALRNQVSGSVYDEHPADDAEWVSLTKNDSFLLVAADDDDPRVAQAQRHLTAEYSSRFANSATYYDEYSTAWRLLGMYIDCSGSTQEQARRLNGAGNGGSSNGWTNADSSSYCRRYFLWAAYVDLEYQGGGIGEYQFHDTVTDEWDASACDATKNSRCAKMDCHLPDTHFTLLGFFKQYDYDDWMEQLFKHEAYCIWSSEQYEFMNNYRAWWPQSCSSTGQKDGNDLIYIDIKPGVGGTMGLGLYTDSSCTIEYKRSHIKLNDVVKNYKGDSVYEHIDSWNEALSTFYTCQPCKAYTLTAQKSNNDITNDPNNGYFVCDDDAGYTNVNQCMKFKTKTDWQIASYKEVARASIQGTINASYTADVMPMFWAQWGLLIISSLIFVIGLIACLWSARPPRVIATKRSSVSVEPLMQ